MNRKKDPSVIHMTPEWTRSVHNANPGCGISDASGEFQYVPARPLGLASLPERLRATWLVWTGRADALIWPGGQ